MPGICLVTGGAGFIGSHLVAALPAAGRRGPVFEDLSTGRRENLCHISPASELIEGTLPDPAAVEGAIAGCEVVFHLGALASVAKSVDDPILNHAVNATGTLNVLNAARKAGVRR